MGSTTSRHGSRPPTLRRPKKSLKRTLSSIFICGSSSSTSPIEMDDSSSEECRDQDNTAKFQRPRKESSLSPGTENKLTSSKVKIEASSESNVVLNENPSPENGVGTSVDRRSSYRASTSNQRVETSFVDRFDEIIESNQGSQSLTFSSVDSDDLDSHERLILDFGDDSLDGGGGGDSSYLGSRTHNITEGRRHSRSEIWERIRGGDDEIDHQNTRCPSGLHLDGACSCESTLTAQETGPRASISRILMLAEALFEVLDEIHRQPLSIVSLPAPESIVDSLPVRKYKNKNNSENDIDQCHICLAEYEEGDKIRVLPCQHEYHMSCIDKWLKEIHRVCPLCRGDVCGSEATVSDPETPLA